MQTLKKHKRDKCIIIKTNSIKSKYSIETYAKLITKNKPIKIKQLNHFSWSLTCANKIGWYYLYHFYFLNLTKKFFIHKYHLMKIFIFIGTTDQKFVNDSFRKCHKNLPYSFEYEFDSDIDDAYCIKMPKINSDVKFTIILMNCQKEFFMNILDFGGQPFTIVNNLIIRPQSHLVNTNFNFQNWETMIKNHIQKFLNKFYYRCFGPSVQNNYNFDKLKVIAAKDSLKRVFVYSARNSTSLHIMCHMKDIRFYEDLLNSCNKTKIIQSNAIDSKLCDSISNSLNSNEDCVENLIDELENMNRDKNNPLYFHEQCIFLSSSHLNDC